jgi:hypothetical protein
LHFIVCPGALTYDKAYFRFIHDTTDFAQPALLIFAGAPVSYFAGFLALIDNGKPSEGIALQSLAFTFYTSSQSL